MLIHALNDYQVTQSGYYNKLYRVKARDLTDGSTETGGWGSETAVKAGAYIQATFLRPVYVTSVTVGGGDIPGWGNTIQKFGKLKLEYSTDGKTWSKVRLLTRTLIRGGGGCISSIQFFPGRFLIKLII